MHVPRRQPIHPQKTQPPSLSTITRIKQASLHLQLSKQEEEMLITQKNTLESNIRATHQATLSEKFASSRTRIPIQHQTLFDSYVAQKANESAQKEIQPLRKPLPVNIRIALITEDIFKKIPPSTILDL